LSEKKDDELTTAELDLRLRELLREKEIVRHISVSTIQVINLFILAPSRI
jgi:hypothetical protein